MVTGPPNPWPLTDLDPPEMYATNVPCIVICDGLSGKHDMKPMDMLFSDLDDGEWSKFVAP